jgi:restriction system protein
MTDDVSQVPIWPTFVKSVLEVLAGGETLSRRELVRRTLDRAGIDEAGRAEVIESGGSRAENRVTWAITHLTKAGWIERPARAQYRIAADGREFLATHPQGIPDFATAHRLFAPYWPKTSPRSESVPATEESVDADVVDPIEQIETGVTRIQTDVADDILSRLRGSEPAFFEEAVVKVLLAMGYGGAEQRGKAIGGTGDGGVDGVIDQDALGLDQIYVQAKRYADGNHVGRETIQAFVGALHGKGASRGVFFTSSSFTKQASDYAASIPTRIILIDGPQLADLMIKYRVGVRVRHTYAVVEVDEVFFE